MAVLQFWFDFSCPYAYVASTEVEALAKRTRAELDARPMLLGGVFRARGTADVPASGYSAQKARHNADDIRRTAAFHGAPLQMPGNHPMRTVDALRALIAVGPPYLGPLAHAFFRAYWVDGIDIATRDGIARVLRATGHDPDEVLAESQTQRVKDELRRLTDEAIELGVFGAPTYLVNGQLYWGVDRSDFVERALGGSPRSQLPDPSRMAPVDFWFDYSSPFSYLAAERAEAVFGSAARWRPMLLGGVFKAISKEMVPFFEQNEAKQRHTQYDLHRQAEAAGVEFRWPSRFPMNTVLPLRVTLLAESRALIRRIYRAYWVEDRDISSPEVVREICDELGLDGASGARSERKRAEAGGPGLARTGSRSAGLVERAQEPAAKNALREATDTAVASGVFGAPTFIVHPAEGEPSLFWGADRLEWAARFAAGDQRLR